MRFVGLGDSLTQGVGDPKPGCAGFHGELEGWVEYFATAVRASGVPVEVHNVAIAGARLEHVLAEQLAAVFPLSSASSPSKELPNRATVRSAANLQGTPNIQGTSSIQGTPSIQASPSIQGAPNFQADIVSCFIGVNDLWDINLDVDLFARRYHELFSTLTALCPVVLTASIHDVFAPYPIRAPLRKKLLEHTAKMNEIINQTSLDCSLVLVDLANRSDMFSRSVLAIDFLHPNRYGHQLIAGEVIGELHARHLLLNVASPAATPLRRGSHDLAHVAWVGGYVKRNWRRWREEMNPTRLESS
jgi:lysophospholipase L1-like esterase